MKIINAILISLVFGTNPIAAQQVAGADDSPLTAHLVYHSNTKSNATVKGFPTPSKSLDLSDQRETGPNGPQPESDHSDIPNNTIIQDSLLQISDANHLTEPIDPATIDAFFLYPNPTSGIVQVKLTGKIAVLVYTISGQLVKKYALAHGEKVLDLSDLPAGIYQVRAKSDEDYFSGKLLIQ